MGILIAISLGTLIVISLISVLTGGNFDKTIDIDSISSTGTVNESTTTFDFGNLSTVFYIDEFQGAIVIIIGLIAILVLLGFRVLDTGLSDETVKTLTTFIEYLILWLIFSVLSYPLIISIHIIGGFLYIVLSILFVIGVFQEN